MLPEKWKAAWLYSQACTQVKAAPSATVRINPYLRPWRSFSSSAWWAQVTVVPDVKSSSVLSSGRCQGLKASMPLGGQVPGTLQAPIAVPGPQPKIASRAACTASAGNNAELKKAQNQATKNITSEAMNRIMP